MENSDDFVHSSQHSVLYMLEINICILSYYLRKSRNMSYSSSEISTSENYLFKSLQFWSSLHCSQHLCYTTQLKITCAVQRGIENQYSATNVMHFLFNLLRIKGLYMFRALLPHPQEALHKRNLVYCVRVMSIGCTRIGAAN
jgi:hypothetical protein